MRETLCGLILAETPVKDSDKFLTVLTAEHGKISLYANHVRSIKRGAFAYTVPMQYCRFEVNHKSDKYNLASGEVLHSFLDLTNDLCKFALAQYALDITRELTVENNDESELLQLALNTLYVIQNSEKQLSLIKATFEFRAMALAGYMPDLSACGFCERTDDSVMFFDIMNGRLICSHCSNRAKLDSEQDDGTAFITLPLSPSILKGLRYVLSSLPSRIFSYSIADDSLQEYSNVCEKYILNHLERGFDTLDFYHEIQRISQ